MPYQVSRTDTGQFVLMDPSTDTVIIDDEIAAGFEKLEAAVASKPVKPAGPGVTGGSASADAATQGSSAFSFQGGTRYTPVLLGVVLPFAWLAVLYFALSNLLSEHALDRGAAEQTQTQIEGLERELQSLRSEISGAPRTAKTKPQRKTKPPKPKPATLARDEVAPSEEVPAQDED